jgi:hypothetical protein
MISVAVVTKRAGFTLTMHSPGHHFTEVRPSAGWLERPLSEDVLVLDLETAGTAAEAVSALRSAGTEQPIIVVANDTDGWDSLIAEHPDLFLVSLPVTQTSLVTTVDRAARLAHVVPVTTAAVTPVEVDTVTAAVAPSEAASRPAARATPRPDSGDSVAAVPRPQTRARQLPPTPASPSPAPEAMTTDPVAVPPPARVAAPVPVPEAAPPPVPVAAPPPVPVADEPVHLVRRLRPLVGRLSRVPEVAELLRQRCAAVVPCEASAVLVPDGEIWRVAAGHQLRPLEGRVQVDAAHWLVTEVIGQGHGLLIRDTDIARTRLSGAPLAAWPNLMALPITEVNAIVLLARQVKEFSRSDLTKGKQAIGPAAMQLGEAMDVRDLARALSPFANPVE